MWMYGIFNWFAANPVARWVAGIAAGLAAFWAFMTLRDRRIRKEAKEEGKQEVIQEITEQTNEAVERVEDERERVADLNDAERLRLAAKSPNNRGRMSRPETD